MYAVCAWAPEGDDNIQGSGLCINILVVFGSAFSREGNVPPKFPSTVKIQIHPMAKGCGPNPWSNYGFMTLELLPSFVWWKVHTKRYKKVGMKFYCGITCGMIWYTVWPKACGHLPITPIWCVARSKTWLSCTETPSNTCRINANAICKPALINQHQSPASQMLLWLHGSKSHINVLLEILYRKVKAVKQSWDQLHFNAWDFGMRGLTNRCPFIYIYVYIYKAI